MGELQLVPAELGGVLIESFIYGMYLVMFIACMYVLVFREMARPTSRRRPLNKPLVLACVVLFMSITTHWCLNFTRAFHAFVKNGDKPNGPLESFARLSDPLNVTKTGLYMLDIIIGDLIMVYRLWVVWNHNKLVCALPAVCVLTVIATGTGITYQFTKLTPDQNVFLSECGRWITSSWSLTLTTNIYCTSMLSYKIWEINRAVRHMGSSTLLYVVIIIIESAAIYTAFSLSAMVSYVSKSNAQFLILNACNPVIGLVFCMIIVRVGLGLGNKHIMTTTMPVTGAHGSASGRSGGTNRVDSENLYAMNPVKVNVMTSVDHQIDRESDNVKAHIIGGDKTSGSRNDILVPL